MTTLTEWLTLVRLALYMAVLLVMEQQLRTCRWKAEPLSWMLWAIHGAIYSVVFLVDYQDRIISTVGYNNWASLVGIHGLIVLISIGITHNRQIRTRDEC